MSSSEWIGLTDEDRDRALRSMPDMLDGFLKTWGWLHFAKAIEEECRKKNTPQIPNGFCPHCAMYIGDAQGHFCEGWPRG